MSDEDVQIIADPEQLKRVVNNIVGNSVKYLDKQKGFINIRIKDVGDLSRSRLKITAEELPRAICLTFLTGFTVRMRRAILRREAAVSDYRL